MKEIISRFIEIRKMENLTQGKMGQRLGVSDVTISKIESGKITLNEKHIKLICGSFGIREEWLRSGEGPMKDEEAHLSEKGKRMLSIFEGISDAAQDLIIEYAEKLVALEASLRGGAPYQEDKNTSTAGEKATHPIHELERA